MIDDKQDNTPSSLQGTMKKIYDKNKPKKSKFNKLRAFLSNSLIPKGK